MTNYPGDFNLKEVFKADMTALDVYFKDGVLAATFYSGVCLNAFMKGFENNGQTLYDLDKQQFLAGTLDQLVMEEF